MVFFKTIRGLTTGLIFTTFFLAMFVSNDVALLVLLPLAFAALQVAKQLKWLAFTFVMMTVAANLGGMILPFGSPQNIFLFSYYSVSLQEFIQIMFLPFIVSSLLIVSWCLFVSRDSIAEVKLKSFNVDQIKTLCFVGLFFFAVLILFGILPVWAGLLIVGVVFFCDRSAFTQVDWGLLIIFIAFFVFAGNMARIEIVENFFQENLNKNVLLWSALGSQVISNVPAAIFLAEFTNDYQQLLIGVNIGGTGTLVASLANLIALAKYREYQPETTARFLKWFVVINFVFFALLVGVMLIVY